MIASNASVSSWGEAQWVGHEPQASLERSVGEGATIRAEIHFLSLCFALCFALPFALTS
jgi:hypothetical protein